jgi:hypothetical protein
VVIALGFVAELTFNGAAMVDHLPASPSPIEHELSESLGEASAQTNTYPRLSSPQSLSAQLWGMDFNALLPRTLSPHGTRAVVGEIARIRTFLSARFPILTEEALGTRSSPFVGDAKRRYLTSTCDLIELRHGDETVGAFVGAPEDWSTYYVRTLAVAREFQEPALVRKLIRECIFAPLQACGVQRIVLRHGPTAERSLGADGALHQVSRCRMRGGVLRAFRRHRLASW